MSDDLQLLIEWSDPWHEFVSSIHPALSRSCRPLAGEAPTGLIPYQGILVSWAVEVALAAAIALPGLRPSSPPLLKYDHVIYFPAHELPPTQDEGGARSGLSGRGGGREARHRTETIRVRRDNSVADIVVDAPHIRMPSSHTPEILENFLAVGHDPGPPPVKGGQSSLKLPSLGDPTVPPSPAMPAGLKRASPSLARQVIPPPPDLPKDGKLSPAEMSPTVVEPAPSVPRGRSRAIATINTPIVPPAPGDPQPPRTAAFFGLPDFVPMPASQSSTGILVSKDPGPVEAKTENPALGSISLSAGGRDKSGLGGSGNGGGLARGSDPGSGLSGNYMGGGNAAAGKGSDPRANPDSSSRYPGRGGTGAGGSGPPPVPGVWVTIGNEPSSPERWAGGEAPNKFPVSIECTSRACNLFASYGRLLGDSTYIFYMETAIGPAVMQYSDPASVSHPYRGRITDPEPISLPLPQGLAHVRMVFACLLDRTGVLRNIKVLEYGPPAITSQVKARLPSWKFVPAMLGNQPIEVSALLGFNIDTR